MTTATYTDLTVVPLDRIVAGNNDRKTFNPDRIVRLAENIDAYGLAQPPTVRPTTGGYEIVAGERRIRALRHLGRTQVTAIVRDLDDQAVADIMLAENTAREDLDPIEEGQAYRTRMDAGATIARVARVAGVPEKRVRRRARLLDLIAEARQMVSAGSMPIGFAEALHGLDANRQRIALRASSHRDLSVQQFTELVAKLRDDQHAEGQEAFDLDGFLAVQDAAATAPSGGAAKRATRRELLDLVRRMAAEVDGPLRDEAVAVLAAA